MKAARRALVTGATGFIGGRLATALAERGWEVRCLVRSARRARPLAELGLEIREADVLDPVTLRGLGEGVEVAYYLVHAMGRGGESEFEQRERRGARNFAEVATREGVGRVVYLGGLGDRPTSRHLRSRQMTAEILAEHGPPLTYFRAGMVVGAESESYRTLRYLVQRLPAMIAPAWLANPTQPIGIDDVISYLAKAPDVGASRGREVQIGGPDVLSYGDMLDRMADAMGLRRRPRIPVPLLTPWLSSLWIGLVTPVDAGIARPLIEGLSTPTTVTDPSGAAPFEIAAVPFDDALQRALADDPEAPPGAGATSGRVRLLADPGAAIDCAGAVSSIQAAEVMAPAAGALEDELRRAGEGYWRFLTRISLGLIGVAHPREQPVVALLGGRLVLLRFRAPEYEVLGAHGSVTWPIDGGLLVSRASGARGFLRLSITRLGPPAAPDATARVEMELRGFNPRLAGGGRLARVRNWIYGRTQARVHRLVTRSYLRLLGSRR